MANGKIFISLRPDETHGSAENIKFDGPMAQWTDRYNHRMTPEQKRAGYNQWLRIKLSEEEPTVTAQFMALAEKIMAGQNINLVYHYLTDGIYCQEVRGVLEEALG